MARYLSEENVVSKSKPLCALDNNILFGKYELMFLDIYLSKINPLDINSKLVQFRLSELEEFLGISSIKKSLIRTHLRNMIVPVELPAIDSNGFVFYPLFSKCSCDVRTDIDSRELWITMECNNEVYSYFFNIANIGYLKYKIGIMKNLSLQSRRIYDHLRLNTNKYRKQYSIQIDEFRASINCKGVTYQENKNFLRLLKTSVAEINENSDIDVSYSLRRNSEHTVTHLEFVVSLKDESKDTDTILGVSAALDVSFDKAQAIVEAGVKNGLDEVDIYKRVDFVASKKNIENKVGYAIAVMNNELWNKITSIKFSPPSQAISEGNKNAQMLREIEELYLNKVYEYNEEDE